MFQYHPAYMLVPATLATTCLIARHALVLPPQTHELLAEFYFFTSGCLAWALISKR